MYKDVVNQKCHFCDAVVTGNQRYMTSGRQLPGKRGRIAKALKAMPEHYWDSNGLMDIVNGKDYLAEFYLCPQHQEPKHYAICWNWAQKQIDGQKALTQIREG